MLVAVAVPRLDGFILWRSRLFRLFAMMFRYLGLSSWWLRGCCRRRRLLAWCRSLVGSGGGALHAFLCCGFFRGCCGYSICEYMLWNCRCKRLGRAQHLLGLPNRVVRDTDL